MKQAYASRFDLNLPFYGLENVKRRGWIIRGVDEDICESVGDHSKRLQIVGSFYGGNGRLYEMFKYHDLAEVITDDITPHDGISKDEKHIMERVAMKKIVEKFSPERKKHVMDIWSEYNEGKTPEAKCAKQLDKMDVVALSMFYDSLGFKTDDIYIDVREKLENDDFIHIFDELMNGNFNPRESIIKYISLLRKAKNGKRIDF